MEKFQVVFEVFSPPLVMVRMWLLASMDMLKSVVFLVRLRFILIPVIYNIIN